MIVNLKSRFDALEEKKVQFLRRLEGMTNEQVSFKPTPEHWDLQQVVQHLMLVEQTFLEHTTTDRYRSRKPRFHPLIGKFLVWFYFKKELKVKVPVKKAVPDGAMPLDQSINLWNEKRNAFRQFFETLNQDGAAQKIFFHPFMGAQNSEDFLIFLDRHFEHHMKQVQRILNAPGFPR